MPYKDPIKAALCKKNNYLKNIEIYKERTSKWKLEHPQRHKDNTQKSYIANRSRYLLEKRKIYSENKELWVKYRMDNQGKIKVINARSKYKYKTIWLDVLRPLGLTKCSKCGYDRSFAAIDFHHPNPSDKLVSPSHILLMKFTEDRLNELKKCIVLCANCHREVHYGIIK